MKKFSELLTRLREKRHKTPRAFYMSVGARKFFGCTYRQYYNIEQGKSLPRPAVFGKIVQGLRLLGGEPDERDLLLCYLRELLGGEELFQAYLAAMGGRRTGEDLVRRKAVGKYFEGRAVRLSPEQSAFIYSSPANNWAFAVLVNDSSDWDAHGLSKLLGFPASAMEKALRKMTELELAVVNKEGRYRSPLAGRPVVVVRRFADLPREKEASLRVLPAGPGETLFQLPAYVRASEAEIRGLFDSLAQSIREVELISTPDRGPDTAMFVAETVVRRLFPF